MIFFRSASSMYATVKERSLIHCLEAYSYDQTHPNSLDLHSD
ncbi:hypothetical protein VIBNISO65_110041 [Vibrio nigripulchritudo SO65]|nr:hypothetical protein VIBNISO65_110041 [Vibrio nigripulchritudo SO65]